ncbi:MAG: Cys-tRNA(Pro) deacylase [Bacillota bacterium]|nr:Cys-tRNA(Pro) deacylase [Bacillota bacterium]
MSKKSKIKKTNAMRLLDQAKIEYTAHTYADTEAISGVEVAEILGLDAARVFKTLVTEGPASSKTGEYFVFMVPVAEELDLKKAAAAVGEKNISMIKSKELLPLTGYIHGGCSPLGMKKQFRTVIHETAFDLDVCPTIFFSAGKIGYQIECKASDLAEVIFLEPADIVV